MFQRIPGHAFHGAELGNFMKFITLHLHMCPGVKRHWIVQKQWLVECLCPLSCHTAWARHLDTLCKVLYYIFLWEQIWAFVLGHLQGAAERELLYLGTEQFVLPQRRHEFLPLNS